MLRCPRCSHSNPDEALFCYYDGAALGDPARRQAVTDPARQRFVTPFVFPSGQTCYTFDELCLAIQANWDEARQLLRQGVLAGFFAGLGRGDLALAANEAARAPDLDRGLDGLLRRLPARVVESAQLLIEPSQINCGVVRPGQDLNVDLHLHNEGMGLLTASVSCEDAAWIALGDGTAHTRRKLLQFRNEATVAVVIRGKALSANRKPFSSRLLIESNGGTVSVPVHLEVPVVPFPEGALAGALSPREIAEKAVRQPKEAAALFASGAVVRWYQSNGWSYPVQDPAVSGVAGVQQFFEALGLSTPPRVTVGATEVYLEARGGESASGTVQVFSMDKKPVYAHAAADQPWLDVSTVDHAGRTATLRIVVKETPDAPGETLHAQVTIRANGRQKFVIPVHLRVKPGGRGRVPTAAPSVGVREEPPPVRRPEEIADALPAIPGYRVLEVVEDAIPVVDHPEELPASRRDPVPTVEEAEPARAAMTEFAWRYGIAALPVLFILIGLLTTLVRDLGARALRGPTNGGSGDARLAHLPQLLTLNFHDAEETIRLSTSGGFKPTEERADRETVVGRWEPSMRFGLVLRDPLSRAAAKRLTFDTRGGTNNTVVRLDEHEWIFGDRPFRLPNGKTLGTWPGRWLRMNDVPDRPMRDGRRSVWAYDEQRIEVAQTVGLVAGAQSDKIDTCLVHYRIDNRDSRPHRVGLRFLLDTYIGGNDGVPFLVPGERQLCVTQKEFNGSAAIPDFIQARETEDLSNPGTIALLQLRVPGFAPPTRVTLGAWPNPELGERCRQEKTLWDVPVLPIKTLTPADSAVVIYWSEQVLPAGGNREMAFAYGLGSVAAGETGGQLGLSVAGSFAPSGEFTLTAEVQQPRGGQTLTVELPPEFALLSGATTEAVPPLPPGATAQVSPVTWKVRAAPREGDYPLRVRSSTGVSQTVSVRVRVRGIFGN